MGCYPQLHTSRSSLRVEASMRSKILRQGFPEVIRTVRIGGFARLLCVVAVPREVPVQISGEHLVGGNCLHAGKADVQLAAPVMRRPVNGPSGYFRLKDGWNRLRFARQTALY